MYMCLHISTNEVPVIAFFIFYIYNFICKYKRRILLFDYMNNFFINNCCYLIQVIVGFDDIRRINENYLNLEL